MGLESYTSYQSKKNTLLDAILWVFLFITILALLYSMIAYDPYEDSMHHQFTRESATQGRQDLLDD